MIQAVAGHETVDLQHPDDGRTISVDRAIAPLMTRVWGAGIGTLQSCENYGGSGYVWLVLDSTEDLRRLIEIVGVFESDPSSIYERLAAHEVAAPDGIYPEDLGQWRYRLQPYPVVDWDEDLDEPKSPTGLGAARWEFAVSVNFPFTDVAMVERRVAEYIDGRG